MKKESKNCNLLKNQQKFVNPFIHHFSSFFGKILPPAISLFLVFRTPCPAADFMDAVDGSWLRTGLFSLRTITVTNNTATNYQIHLFRYADGKFEKLFTKAIGHAVKPPICLTNGVIVVSVDGVIRRLDLKGEYVFAAKPKGFDGLAREIGRLDDFHHIFMVGGVFNEKINDVQYRLYMVDVSGTEPVVTTKFDIVRPYGITLGWDPRLGNDIVVVGETNVLRLKIPNW